jgi:hypothetical protein
MWRSPRPSRSAISASGEAVLGRDTEDLDDAVLRDLVERMTVFAKVSPLQKARIIRMLHANGHTVGFLGDGINDAAALRDADVGISVDTAADIAKESADIILAHDNQHTESQKERLHPSGEAALRLSRCSDCSRSYGSAPTVWKTAMQPLASTPPP